MAGMESYEAAKLWRLRNRYTVAAISLLTGFSRSSITDFETGIVRGDITRPIDPNAMRRYTLCCAAIAHKLHDWNFTDD